MDDKGKPLVIPIFIPHHGCPHQCIFCNQNVIAGQKNQVPGTDQIPGALSINRTIQDYLKYQGKRSHVELAFFGGNFLGLPPKMVTGLLNIVQPYIKDGAIQGIRFSTRPDTISTASLDLIKPFEISMVELGVQSMDDGVLAASGRGHTAADTTHALDLLKQRGYPVGVQLMVGLPKDNEATLLSGTKKIAGLAPDIARIYPLLVLAQSPLAKLYNQGKYSPLSLDKSIELVKKMVVVLERAHVRVIRVGLQASDIMADESQMLAGPWHPAFGHLVFSSLMYDALVDRIKSCQAMADPGRIRIFVHPRSESRLRGDKNGNLEKLPRDFPGLEFEIIKDSQLAVGQVRVENETV